MDKDAQSGDYWESTEEEVTKVKKHIKDHYKIAQDFTCVYCQQKVLFTHGSVWDIEHIIPKNPYPQFLFTEENLVVSCKNCNGIKSAKNVLKNKNRKRFPKKSEDYIIVHPHFDEYDEHITRFGDNHIFVGNTPKGRETKIICGLDRFLPKYFKNESLDISKKAQNLANDLCNAKTSHEHFFLMSLMEKIMKDGMNDMLN